ACGSKGLGSSPSDGGAGSTTDSGASSTGDTAAAACTIAPPSTATLPHGSATGAKAAGITKALDAIFAAQTPPVIPGATYSIAKLSCSYLQTIFKDANGPRCGFAVTTAGGQTKSIELSPPSTLAQDLMTALIAAGSVHCEDP